ncbi:MAG: PQQ-binding-like beta-propeller repeat protein [Planctomycetaceae bacterium]
MMRSPKLLVWLAAFCLACTADLVAADWPQFRGPGGQGRSDETGLAVEWSPTKNIAWRIEVPGEGWSSPVVADGKVVLTAAVRMPGHQGEDRSLRALCYDARSGESLWDVEVFEQKDAQVKPIHSKNSHASPSPVVDGGQVFVHFGPQGTAALAVADGKALWRNADQKYDPRHGNGGSPILVDDMLVFICDGLDVNFMVALDRRTGRVKWRKPRPPVPNQLPRKFSFATPTAIQVGNRTQIISPSTDQALSYDTAGRMLWRVRYTGYSVIPLPVYAKGLVFLSTGWDKPTLAAIKPDGRGDVSNTHVAWQTDRGTPHSASVLAVGDELYYVTDNGVASCVDVATGTQQWQHRLGGDYSASPVHADGKIYFCSEQGTTTVVAAETAYRELGRNDLRERTLATPALADGAIFLRTEKALYRIAEP